MSNDFPAKVSDVFDPSRWRTVSGFDDFQDMTYHRQVERDADGKVTRDLPTVRIAFNRPEVRNAFRPGTVDELYRAMDHARMTPDVATVLLTGNGPPPRTVATPSVPAGTSGSAAATVIGTPTVRRRRASTPRGPAACTSWKSSGSCGPCPRWSSPS
ncbi:1,4-Dihydroxy-2-naphthoyl-CoA synthase [Arthrobacter sp. Hiyo8]|nr:1,4-Dihydroxy-2-naphthoyl-CoA synthase [Arthrobacter sp. Hiyo8]